MIGQVADAKLVTDVLPQLSVPVARTPVVTLQTFKGTVKLPE